MKHFTLIIMAFLLMAAAVVQAQDKPAATPVKGFRGQFLRDLGNVEKKFLDLAAAIPAETYAWRPGEGVRSVSEVFMHVALDNFGSTKFIGAEPPEGLTDDMEKTVIEKKKVINILKRSFELLKNTADQMSDPDLDKATKSWGGHETTYEGVLFGTITHCHEHLGQMIAYARMNKIVPPWTAAEQAAEKKTKKEGQ